MGGGGRGWAWARFCGAPKGWGDRDPKGGCPEKVGPELGWVGAQVGNQDRVGVGAQKSREGGAWLENVWGGEGRGGECANLDSPRANVHI